MSRSSIRIPAEAGRQDIAPNLDLVSQAADQVGALLVIGNDARDRHAVLGDDQALRVQSVQQRQALLLELRGFNRFHVTPPSESTFYTTGHEICPFIQRFLLLPCLRRRSG